MGTYFVHPDSIVRNIWGKADTILFIFAGASAEFALNKSVDWLYFTGRLPADPLGRLFSTVSYAQKILFSEYDEAIRNINQITAIHKSIEFNRGMSIPDEAYLDVLYLLIDYSIRSYQLLEKPLTEEEKTDIFEVFYRLGNHMRLANLPGNYQEWLRDREKRITDGLSTSALTKDLYRQYKKHLGPIRYQVLKQAQLLVMPSKVRAILGSDNFRWLLPVLIIYKFSRLIRFQNILRDLILPQAYLQQVKAMDTIAH